MSMHFFLGFFVILVGFIMFLNNFGLTDVSLGYMISTYWPVVLMYWGVILLGKQLVGSQHGEVKHHGSKGEAVSGIILLVLGILFIGNNMGLFQVDLSFFWQVFWPIILIIFGINLVRKRSVKGSKSNIAFMGGTELGKKSPLDLKSESYWAVMGGIDLDLRNANIPEGETILDLTAVMGGIEIIIPEDLPVVCEGMAVLGGVEFMGEGTGGIVAGKNMSYRMTNETKTFLVIQARAFMGGIEVKK